MASPTRWTWVWVNSRRWWWTGRPGVLRFMGLQRVGHDWATELNWTEWLMWCEITLRDVRCEIVCVCMCVWMWELDYKESWALKNWCFWTVVSEKTLESPLDCKEIQPVHPKGNQSWTFIGRTDARAETPIFWPPDAKNWITGKDSDAGKNWRQEEKGTTEDKMGGWHYQLTGNEFE